MSDEEPVTSTGRSGKTEPRSIKLPDSVEIFSNLRNAKRFAIDIGGSLTKIAYYSTVRHRKASYHQRRSNRASGDPVVATDANETQSAINSSRGSPKNYEVQQNPRLHFIKFETKYIENCLDFVKSHLTGSKEFMKGKSIKATGGGAFKYADIIQEKLGLAVDKEDEMGCLIKGTNFLLKNISDEAFTFQRHGTPEYVFQNADPNVFPYLLVNIGSGVSVMKVVSDEEYERIGGTATGGGTFWGLGSLLTSAKGFDELLELAEKGDHRKVDMLVKDIYGGDYATFGLPGDLIASSFGKATHLYQKQKDFSEADLARSLLFTISNDIGQVACLYAMLHNLKKIYFGGYFLRNHPLSMHTVSYSINYWSQGKVQAMFLRHEGYLGAIGAFLKGAEEWDSEKYSWVENYAGSSGLVSSISAQVLNDNFEGVMQIGQLEMDLGRDKMSFCPFLELSEDYYPDTVDLTKDDEARNYWLDCFEGSVAKFETRAKESQPDSPSASHRAGKFREKFIGRLRYLQQKPYAYGHLTVRSLLDTIEHYLKEFDFPDPYLRQKQEENEAALQCLKDHLDVVDALETRIRREQLIRFMLAGNMFDWGAKEVAELLENQNAKFGFQEALQQIPERPWLVDDLDAWVNRMMLKPPHKCVAIFVDNSGIDIVLGILPFAREFLKQGTEVILCSNSAPALNDVTHYEMVNILKQAADICPILREAIKNGSLVSMETGQTGPCLDLRCISHRLCEEMKRRQVDLIVIEGMGRSVHTNLNVKFTCECLKVAVIKNRWLAKRLGGDIFSVICRYQS